jgi:hypothetical protein
MLKLKIAFASVLFFLCASPAFAGLYGYAIHNPPPIPSGAYIGCFANTHGHISDRKTALQQHETDLETQEAAIGRRCAIQLSYYGFRGITSSNIKTDAMIQGDITYHRIPLIAWSCGAPLTDIASGLYDVSVIKPAALLLKALNIPIMVRPFHEFNLCFAPGHCANGDYGSCFSQPFSNDTAEGAEYIAYFEHLYNVFQSLGATNVSFVFCPNANAQDVIINDLTKYLPPAPYAAWIAGDGYDKLINSSGTKVPSEGFQAALAPFYNTFSFDGRPMMIGETGEYNSSVPPTAPWTQAQYWTDISTTANPSGAFPLLHAVNYFSSEAASPFDWILDSGGLTEMAAVGATPYFSYMGF